MKKLFLLPCLLIALSSVAQTKLIIRSSDEKEANVSTLLRNNAFGDAGFWAERADDPPSYTIRSFLQFDLSSIPQGSFVNWAKLSLYFSFGRTSDSALLRRVTSAWDPATVTWNTQPTTSKRGTVKLPMTTGIGADLKNIDVWTLVQAMVDSPATSFGFAIRLDSDVSGNANRSTFFDGPSGPKRYIPKLVIEYTASGMHPAVTSMSADANGESTAMTIYPNPCNKAFNCNIKSAETDNMALRVIDILGRTVYSQPVNSSNLQLQVNLPSSSAGTYFVILQDNKGATIVSQQLQVN